MSGAVTAVRPNGKPYTRRKRPYVETDWDLDSWGDGLMLVVMRTHDVDEAVALCWGPMRSLGYDVLPAPELRWVRMAVCMCGGGHGFDMVEDKERGVPAVEFRA